MYSLLRNAEIRRQLAANARSLLTGQALSLLPALAVTQLFFHWKSFLLEFGGFLVVWFVLDMVVTAVRGLVAKPAPAKIETRRD